MDTSVEFLGFDRTTDGKPVIGLDDESLYCYGLFIRRTETLILDLFSRGLLSGTTHTCIGQEICQMSVVRSLDDPDDVVLSNHRNHGHFLTYSGDPVGLVAEIMGREAGICGGYGGSQHLAHRNFHSNGVQAGMTGIGAGLALANRRRHSNGVVAVMVGDGTLGEGLLYESMNLAGIWGTRFLIVVENNGIAQTTPTAETLAGTIPARGEAFGLETWHLDDADPSFSTQAADVVSSIRRSGRPGMLVIDTKRMGPHSKGDDLRDEETMGTIRERDPLTAIGRRLSDSARDEIDARASAFLREIEQVALASPEATFVTVPEHSYRHLATRSREQALPVTETNVRQSLNRAMHHLLERYDDTILLGEDLHEPYGGAFKVTAGLSEAFPGRVLSTPISEAGIVGAGIGLALAGFRPLVEIMFADFVSLCFDQLYNHASKFPGMFAELSIPLIVRTPCGGRRGYGPTHSQSPENLLVSIPGLTVVYPSHRHNVGQMLIDTQRCWANPTVFLEHKLLYAEKQDPGDYEVVEAEPGDLGDSLFPILRRGSNKPDVTLVSYGGMLPVVEAAATTLEAEEELEIEIVVPSALTPLPTKALTRSLAGRPAIGIVEESHNQFGVGAEILAQLAEAGHRGTFFRVGTPPVPIASARSLERDLIPDQRAIIDGVLKRI